MSFSTANAMRYNNIESVDAEFSAILAEINYTNDIFEPRESFNDAMEEKAGQTFVRKLGKGTVAGTDATAANGLKFDTTQTADSLLVLNKIYALSKSELCPGAVDAARKSGKTAQKKEVVLRTHQEAWQGQAMALLLRADNHTADSDVSVPTAETIVDLILAAQTRILESDAECNICIVSPAVRALLLTNFAKGKGFLPETNEEAKRRGIIGDLLGLTVKVSNFLGAASNIAGKITGAGVHADITAGAAKAKKTDFIVYDWRTYYIDTVFEGIRENPYVPNYIGLAVDVQTVSGALNTNPERCIAHIHA